MTINRAMERAGWLKPGRAGGAVVRSLNPYGNPCPGCGAKRYERCFKYHRAPIIRGQRDGSDFIYIKDKPCSQRVPLTLGISIEDDNEGENGEVIDNDYRGCDL